MKSVRIIIILVVSITATPGWALLEINPYGNLYMFLGYRQANTFDSGLKEAKDTDLIYTINHNSNLGFDFKYSDPEQIAYSGVFELGVSDADSDYQVRIRKAYGAYKDGLGELLVGQNWSPYVNFSNEMADFNRSERFGALYEYPTLQLKYTLNPGFYLAIMKPYVPTVTYYDNLEVDNPESATDASNTEYRLEEIKREITTKQKLENIQSMIPKAAIGYTWAGYGLTVNTGGAMNVYQIAAENAELFNKDKIYSYLGYLGIEYIYDRIAVKLHGGYAVNPANFGIETATKGNDTYSPGAAAAIYNIATKKYEIKDTWSIQSYIEMRYKISSMYVIHGGYGFSMVDYPMQNSVTDYAAQYYLNMKIGIGGMIAITPSFSYYDYMKDMADVSEGDEIKAGILTVVSYY